MKLHFHSGRRGHLFGASPEDSKPIRSQPVILISVHCRAFNTYFSACTNSLICPRVFLLDRFISGNSWYTEALTCTMDLSVGLDCHFCKVLLWSKLRRTNLFGTISINEDDLLQI